MFNKALASLTAALVTLSIFAGTVSTMNYAAADYATQYEVA